MSQNNNNNSANIAYGTIINVSLIWDNDTNNLTNNWKMNYYGYKQPQTLKSKKILHTKNPTKVINQPTQ